VCRYPALANNLNIFKCKGVFFGMVNILLTGATGFIGKYLIDNLVTKGFQISVIVRHRVDFFPEDVKQFVVGDFVNNLDFSDALKEIDCVVHLAGKAHVIDKNKASILDEFRKINTDLTLYLAREAIKSKVKRFVFLSSIRVNGNQNNTPFLETDTPNPQEPYAISKFEAEQGLLQLTKNNDMEVVIIRPPLVYANNAPGNFGRMVSWVKTKNFIPLPLGRVNNKRSLVAVDNLNDFILTCIQHKNAKNEIFLVKDDENMSTTQLLKKIANAYNKNIFLLPVPVGWMIFVAKIIGKKADAVRLFASLEVDSSKAKKC
jgi:nucleoside-diphosphate-sugar epimerase